ncbi:MAG: hypothetical protein PHU42_03740 [Patescibacteria group bacterium]|nr:hypothetical protein [Patescibacteria group bacterium]
MRKFNKKSLAIFGIGALLIASSVLVLGSQTKNQKAQAASTSYNYTWNVTMWHNAGYANTPVLSVGPAQWTVSGNVGTKNILETWTVPYGGWMSGTTKCAGITYTDETTFRQPQSSGGDFNNQIICSTGIGNAGNYTTSGLYQMGPTSSNNNTTIGHTYSFPTKWTVTGKICDATTPPTPCTLP